MDTNPVVIMMGTACMDEYYRLDHWIGQGDKIEVQYIGREMGGMMPNAACVLANLGVPTGFLDTVNTGTISQSLLSQLRNFGVDTALVQFKDNLPDARCFIFLSENERTVMAVHPQKPALVPDIPLMEHLCSTDYFYTTLYNFQNFSDPEKIIMQLKKHGVKIAFDIENHSYSETDRFLISNADLLFFNEYGFEHYCTCDDLYGTETANTGSHGCSESFSNTQPPDCITRLFQNGVTHIVVTLGEKGCCCYCPDQTVSVPGMKVIPVDTTGAGDTFNAAFLYALIRKYPLLRAAQFANKAAALSVTAMGPKAGVRSEEDIWKFNGTVNSTSIFQKQEVYLYENSGSHPNHKI